MTSRLAILSCGRTTGRDSDIASVTTDWVRQAECWTLAEMPNHPSSLRQMARRLGVSQRALNEAFRRHVGRESWDYMRDLRLHRIQWMLDAGHKLCLDSARLLAGYRSRCGFLRDFMHLFGTIPDDWLLECSLIGRLLGGYAERSVTFEWQWG